MLLPRFNYEPAPEQYIGNFFYAFHALISHNPDLAQGRAATGHGEFSGPMASRRGLAANPLCSG